MIKWKKRGGGGAMKFAKEGRGGGRRQTKKKEGGSNFPGEVFPPARFLME